MKRLFMNVLGQINTRHPKDKAHNTFYQFTTDWLKMS